MELITDRRPTHQNALIDESSLFILGDDPTAEDALDILTNAAICKRNHLDGFGTAHLVEPLATVALSIHELAVFQALEVMRDEIRLTVRPFTEGSHIQGFPGINEGLKDTETGWVAKRLKDVCPCIIHILV
jgi:hypothetical protein